MNQSNTLYNDNEPYVCEWLTNLVNADLITPGDILCKGIEELDPRQVSQYTRVHLFAGVAGWDLALQMADWPEDLPVWTGSCPCQPFSVAGKQKGTSDERHLWPYFRDLIQECEPPVIFGEQVASPSGREWAGYVSDDLQRMGYAFVCQDRCAAGVGAPHIRQRLYWCAIRVADTIKQGLERHTRDEERRGKPRWFCSSETRPASSGSFNGHRHNLQSPWSDGDWVLCEGGTWRPYEPGTFPMVDGVPERVGKIRAYGNAIVPQVAAEFIKDVRESIMEGVV